MRDVDPVERAFQLARSGEYTTVEEIRRAVGQEGRRTDAITGPSLQRQLRELIRVSVKTL